MRGDWQDGGADEDIAGTIRRNAISSRAARAEDEAGHLPGTAWGRLFDTSEEFGVGRDIKWKRLRLDDGSERSTEMQAHIFALSAKRMPRGRRLWSVNMASVGCCDAGTNARGRNRCKPGGLPQCEHANMRPGMTELRSLMQAGMSRRSRRLSGRNAIRSGGVASDVQPCQS